MRLFILLVFTLLLPTTALADPREIDALSSDLAVALADVRAETESVADLLSAAGSPGVRREIRRKLARIDELTRIADDLSARLTRIAFTPVVAAPPPTVVVVDPTPHVTPDVVVVDAGPVACSASDHGRLLAAVENEAFSDAKLIVLREAVAYNWFTVDQVVAFMGAMSFGKDKVEAAAVLHPRVIDLENWYRVYGALTFDSEKEELRKRVGS